MAMTKLKAVMHRYRCSRRMARELLKYLSKQEDGFLKYYYGQIGVSKKCKLRHV